MKVAVVVFPGTNCEYDVVHALGTIGVDASLVFHQQTDLTGFDAVVLPGGFAHGDYLRTGAIARFSPVMGPVADMARAGGKEPAKLDAALESVANWVAQQVG